MGMFGGDVARDSLMYRKNICIRPDDHGWISGIRIDDAFKRAYVVFVHGA
jgi:hypothetical protein